MSDVINVIKPAVITLFGITGDLSRNKIMPALYHLFKNGHVHQQTYLVGTSRQALEPSDITSKLQQTLEASGETVDQTVLQRLNQQISMVQLDPNDKNAYPHLLSHLQQLEQEADTELEQFFYLSLPPQVYVATIEELGKHGLNHGRLLVEKPFGYNLQSAHDLIAKTAEHFSEEQIFRIDHYLAKETAQNILTFRSQNPLFSSIWNNRHITKISVTAAESIGIEGRANFYDGIGALRDVIQSHLLQLLSVTLMDIPADMTAEAVHAAKQAVLDDLQPVPTDQVDQQAVRGQYNGYLNEIDNDHSSTETFAAVTLYSRSQRWQDVPLQLMNGKGLKRKRTSITVDFGPGGVNRLQFRIQPNEGISLKLLVKQPGLATETSSTTMDFEYQTAFHLPETLEAYERVLIDAMRGDRTLFATDQEVIASWELLQPVLDAWQANGDSLQSYPIGSDGPC